MSGPQPALIPMEHYSEKKLGEGIKKYRNLSNYFLCYPSSEDFGKRKDLRPGSSADVSWEINAGAEAKDDLEIKLAALMNRPGSADAAPSRVQSSRVKTPVAVGPDQLLGTLHEVEELWKDGMADVAAVGRRRPTHAKEKIGCARHGPVSGRATHSGVYGVQNLADEEDEEDEDENSVSPECRIIEPLRYLSDDALEASEDYDTDMDVEDTPTEEDFGIGTKKYRQSCIALDTFNYTKVEEQLTEAKLDLKHQKLGNEGAKSVASALMKNTKVQKLVLEDNCIEQEGTVFIMDMLASNYHITYLNLSDNVLGQQGSAALGQMLEVNIGLTHLKLRNCKMTDSDILYLIPSLERTERIAYLDLGGNEFRETGVQALGSALGVNNSIEYLNLNWNHIRKAGAISLLNGIKRNYCLTILDLSWNGLGFEGAIALSNCLRTNNYLKELDVTSNRIAWKGAQALGEGLKDNYCLEILKIGRNPLTMTGCLDILQAVNNDTSEVEYLSFEGIPINRRINFLAQTIGRSREFKIDHGGVIETQDILGERKELVDDPLNILLSYLEERAIRPVELYRTFEKDNSGQVTREKFIKGLKNIETPLQTWEMQQAMEILDSKKLGFITYSRLKAGIKERQTNNKKLAIRQTAERKKERKRRDRLLHPEKPTIHSNVTSTQGTRAPSVMSTSSQHPLSRTSRSKQTSRVDLRASRASTSQLEVPNASVGRKIQSWQKSSHDMEVATKMGRLGLDSSTTSLPRL